MTTPVALLALDDAEGLIDLTRALQAAGFRVVVAGQVIDHLASAGLAVEALSTRLGRGGGLGEAIDLGHSHLTGGLSVRWNEPDRRAQAEAAGLWKITLLVASLPTTAATLGGLERLNHGPCVARAHLLRLAAIHAHGVGAVVVDAADYTAVADGLVHDTLTDDERERLRGKALAHVAAFDALTHQARGISPHEAPQQGLVLAPWPVPSTLRMRRLHDPSGWLCGVQPIELISGPLPDAETLISLDAAMQMAAWGGEGATAATAIHGHACAFAVSLAGVPRAVMRAMGADPVAARGGVLVCRGELDVTTARALLRHPSIAGLAVLAATDISQQAKEVLQPLATLLLLRVPGDGDYGARVQLRSTRFGVFMRDVADPLAAEADGLLQLGAVAAGDVAQTMLPVAMHACRQLAGAGVALADGEGTIVVCGGQAHAMDAIQVATAKARRVARACVAVVDATVTRPQAIAALQRAKVTALVVRGLGAESAAMIAAADAAAMPLLQLPAAWASARL